MLLAASESAVTKKPRFLLMMRRSSSVSPAGFFHSSMSRLMLISCGIQWLAQAARYFSQAHLYLKGTSWLTSALELMMRLSSTLTRRKARHRAIGGMREVKRPEGQHPPARHQHRVDPGGARRRPQRREKRAGESAAAESDH